MKSKPVVMEHFSTIHTSFIVDFTFTNSDGRLWNWKNSNYFFY